MANMLTRPGQWTYRMASGGAGKPYHLDRGSSPTMTSALRDAGIGVDGGYPVDRRHPADSDQYPSQCVSVSGTARIGRSSSSKLDQ